MASIPEAGTITKENAFWALVGAEQTLWTFIPKRAFPEEVPGMRQALTDIQTRRLELQRELRYTPAPER